MLRFSETPPSIHSPNTADRLTAHYDLRRFHPENAARWLLAGVSESAPISAGLLLRNQSDMLARCLPQWKCSGVPITNSQRSALSGPTPGCVISRHVT